jgi:hypothetical protein
LNADPDPETQINADPCGSGSETLVPVPYRPSKAHLMWLLSGMNEQMILERLIGLEPGSALRTLVQLSVFSVLVLLQFLKIWLF